MVSGLDNALEVNTSPAVLVPVVVGAKVTSTVQVVVGASAVAEQVSVVRVNWSGSAPDSATALSGNTRSAVPELVTVTVLELLDDPTAWSANPTGSGSAPNPGVVPVPDRVTAWGELGASVVKTLRRF